MGKDAGERNQAHNRLLVSEWMGEKWTESESCSVMSGSLWPQEFSRPEYWSG